MSLCFPRAPIRLESSNGIYNKSNFLINTEIFFLFNFSLTCIHTYSIYLSLRLFCFFLFFFFVYMCAGLNLYNKSNLHINTKIFFFLSFFFIGSHPIIPSISPFCFLANIRTHVHRFKSITICYETTLAVSSVRFHFDSACSSNLYYTCVFVRVNFFLSNHAHISCCCLSRQKCGRKILQRISVGSSSSIVDSRAYKFLLTT